MREGTQKPFFPELRSARFLIRPLQEIDVSDTYVSWFLNRTVRSFITAAQSVQTLETLKSYVREHLKSTHSFLLGIFTLDTNRHIGNIKFDYIDVTTGVALVGILIGDTTWRGKGVFKEVFMRASQYFSSELGIKDYWLGVHLSNTAALQAYKNTGFREAKPPVSLIPDPTKGLFMHYRAETCEF